MSANEDFSPIVSCKLCARGQFPVPMPPLEACTEENGEPHISSPGSKIMITFIFKI